MSLTYSATAHLLLATALLLGVAYLAGQVFVRARYPRVIGEIVGGFLLGPTVFGVVLPGLHRKLLPATGVTPVVLGALYQLGLIFLMFTTGAGLGSLFRRGERRVAMTITLSGVLLPFFAGIFVFRLLDLNYLEGSAHNSRSLSLVFAAGIAVTSIPVISRIMIDLKVINTPFARIVLNAAVIEDVLLYAVLAVAVGLAESATGEFGLASVLGVGSAAAVGAIYYAVATMLVLLLALGLRPLLTHTGANLSPLGAAEPQLIIVFIVTGACLLLSVTPVFGGLVAGIIVGSLQGDASAAARASIDRFAFAFFIPIYFAIVGLRLNLLHGFNVWLFIAFVSFACAIKAGSVYIGGRLAGETSRTSRNLAVAMNARGGPGIVLASVALDAHIIGQDFYAYLVVLSLVTSLMAGLWLERLLRSGVPLRESTPSHATCPARWPARLTGDD